MTFSHLELFKSQHLSGAEKRITRQFHDLAMFLQEDRNIPSSETRTQMIKALAEVKDHFVALVSNNGGNIEEVTSEELTTEGVVDEDLEFDPNPDPVEDNTSTEPVVEANDGEETTAENEED